MRSQRSDLNDSDRSVLENVATAAGSDEFEIEVELGALLCPVCRVYYPVYNGIPRMLTFETEVARLFRKENPGWIASNLSGFQLSSQPPPPGEENVLRNFSTEWTKYTWSGKSYWSGSPEQILDYMRFLLGTKSHPLRYKLCLEVGIGIGGSADGLARAEDCEIVGVDLSYAVDQAMRYFGKNPRLHIVQASVFALPFKPATFDVVYSQGVLHHTYSTQEAFRRVAALPKTGGMLYVWVYSHEDERASPLRRVLMFIENIARPPISRLPYALQTLALAPTILPYIVYQNVFRRTRKGRYESAVYGLAEALHAARDRFTPQFAYRHSYDEIAAWFKSHQYDPIELVRDDPLPPGFPETLRRCVGIRGFLSGPK